MSFFQGRGSAGRHQTCLPSLRKESSARVYARYVSSEILFYVIFSKRQRFYFILFYFFKRQRFYFILFYFFKRQRFYFILFYFFKRQRFYFILFYFFKRQRFYFILFYFFKRQRFYFILFYFFKRQRFSWSLLARHLYTRQLVCESQTGSPAYFPVAVRNGTKETTSSLDRSSTSSSV